MMTIASPTIDRPHLGLCLDCNYPLGGLPSPRCPECGRAFDPNDLDTFNPGRPIPRWAAWAMGPISLPVDLAVVAAIVVTLWRARLPGEHFNFRNPVLWGWLMIAAVWTAWPVIRFATLSHFGWPKSAIKPMRRAHWVIPMLVLAMVLTLDFQLPRKLAFRQSRPAIEALAREVMSQPHLQHDNRWVGLYFAKRMRALPGGFRFTAQDDDVQFKAGFEYMPSLNPKTNSFHAYTYMGDGWWAWRDEG